jgi:hypothetical protein
MVIVGIAALLITILLETNLLAIGSTSYSDHTAFEDLSKGIR